MPLSRAAWMAIVAGLIAVAVLALVGWPRRTPRDQIDLGTVRSQWIAEHRSPVGH
jgi:hypothetical protein